MFLLFVISIGLIVYLSLFPWHFVAGRRGNPLWIVLASWPRITTRRILLDIAVNIAIYVPVGLFGYLAMRRKLSRAPAALLVVVIGTALSLTIEVLQVSIPGRVPSGMDVLTNCLGTAVGVVLVMLVERRYGARPAVRLHAIPARMASALMALACFAGYQLYPLMPRVSLPGLLKDLRGLATVSSFSIAVWAISVTDWIAAAALLNGTLGRSALPALCVLLAMIPARLVIVGRDVTLAELAAIPAALIARSLLARAGSRQFAIAGVILAGAVLWRGLTPFHMGNSPFSWAPFVALFSFSYAPVITLLKAFRYGALVWLLRACGWRTVSATAAVVLFLFCIELMQVRMEGHTPEITDPLIALLFGVVLLVMERHRSSAR